MYRARTMGASPIPAMLLAMALLLGVSGCDRDDDDGKDLAPTFGASRIADKFYTQNFAIDPETLPQATGGNGALTYSISPPLPVGLVFDPATRVLSGTPTTLEPAIVYTYTVKDSDAWAPDSASLSFNMAVEPVADVNISAEAVELNEGEDRNPIAITVTMNQAVTGEVTVVLASTGTATLGGDFDLASAELTIAEGNTSATTTIAPIRDLEAEGDETILLEIDSVDGKAEMGSTTSVEVVIRDLGAPSKEPEGDYAAFEALLLSIPFFGFETTGIKEDSLALSVLIRNAGTVLASPTTARLLTTTDLLSSDHREIASLTVRALGPGPFEIFLDTIHVPFTELTPGANNFFLLEVEAVPEEDPALVEIGAGGAVDYSGVFLTADNRIRTTCTGFERQTQPGTADPLFQHQWSLVNTGQTSFAANGGMVGEDLNMMKTLADGRPTGRGVQVAVVDSGLEICHPDLAANVEPGKSYNFQTDSWYGARIEDPFFPMTAPFDHGTSVAGLIAAVANNGVGGRGVAPNARLRGFNWLGVDQDHTIFDALGMSSENPKSDDVDIFNMSFGSEGAAENVGDDLRTTFEVGVKQLRDGRGALYVKAAGNEFNLCTELDDNGQPVAPLLDLSTELGCIAANRDGENNLPYLIVTGGFSADGKRSSYSSAGSTLWVVAPAGEDGRNRPAMITTDQMGCDSGFSLPLFGDGLACGTEANPLGDYTSVFSGTSASTPNTVGAIALLLETQPELTWRDVKHILAKTARQLDPDIPRVRVAFGGTPAVLQHGWITNAAGYLFHNWYGFGAVDVDAAVALAATHAPNSLGPFTETDPFRSTVATAIPDHDGGGLTETQNVTGLSPTANIEAVQLRIEVTHSNPRDLGIELISPAGTPSILNPVFNDALDGLGVEDPLEGSVSPDPQGGLGGSLDWTILSNAFYGEPPSGEWTLKIIDAAEGDAGTLDAWSLIFYLGEHPEDS